MESRKRMYRALGSLVVAMTVAALLLSWVEPPGEGDMPSQQLAEIDAELTTALDEAGWIDSRRWQNVEILTAPQRTGGTLSGMADATDAHFLIDSQGRLQALMGWRHQTPHTGAPTTLRIQIASPGDGKRMSESQHLVMRMLIAALSGRLETTAREPLAIYFDDGWAAAYGYEPGTVLHLQNASPNQNG